MQRKQEQELSSSQNIMATVLKSMPKDASITKIVYEGPRIAIYTNKPRFLMENNDIISNLVNQIKKRIVIRTDEKIRKIEEDARKIIETALPKEADLQGIFFDTAIGEASLDIKRPWLCKRGSKEFDHTEITEQTGWRLRIKKAPTNPSNTIQAINYNLKVSSSDRAKQLTEIGDHLEVAVLYALALIGILGVHEAGHLIAAKWHKIKTTWPYFIPGCLLYTSPSPRDGLLSRMPSSA